MTQAMASALPLSLKALTVPKEREIQGTTIGTRCEVFETRVTTTTLTREIGDNIPIAHLDK